MPSQALQRSLKDLKLYQLFRQARGISPLQEKGVVRRQLPLSPRRQARPSQQPPVSAQAGLVALPQELRRARNSQERHRQPVGWQVTRLDPNRDRDFGSPGHCCRNRHRHCPLRHLERYCGVRAFKPFQTPRTGVGEDAAHHDQQDKFGKSRQWRPSKNRWFAGWRRQWQSILA